MSDAHLWQRYVTRMKKSNGIGAEGVHNRDVANVHNAIHGAKRKLEWELIPEAVAFCYGPSVLYGELYGMELFSRDRCARLPG